jgi:NAD(P)H-dependent FMN reductase
MPHIQIILGSTRQGRLSEPIGKWLLANVNGTADATFEIVDLLDFDLPLFNETILPAAQKYQNEYSKKWSAKISQADGYIFITPEYNHGTSAALKNAIDFLYMEWKYKPVAFVGYGTVGGVRAIEQLVGVAVGVNMFPLSNQVHIYEPWNAFDKQGGVIASHVRGNVLGMVTALVNVATKTQNLRQQE